ncbi:unnamed protein product [Symbiodinium natans]|uniref:Uncharacterized protein n=1 Tax=Symbiodinium natans TaxID=878477 RepID=A0A812S2M4_9DINO|nr:unnamed protein product [Symbiodinium natans]
MRALLASRLLFEAMGTFPGSKAHMGPSTSVGRVSRRDEVHLYFGRDREATVLPKSSTCTGAISCWEIFKWHPPFQCLVREDRGLLLQLSCRRGAVCLQPAGELTPCSQPLWRQPKASSCVAL